eukprot:gene31284-38653_t
MSKSAVQQLDELIAEIENSVSKFTPKVAAPSSSDSASKTAKKVEKQPKAAAKVEEPKAEAGEAVVEFVDPPAGSKPGDRISGEGLLNEPLAVNRCDKVKAFELVAPDLKVNEEGVAYWQGHRLVTAAGYDQVEDSEHFVKGCCYQGPHVTDKAKAKALWDEAKNAPDSSDDDDNDEEEENDYRSHSDNGSSEDEEDEDEY